jgi:hypothetical protein
MAYVPVPPPPVVRSRPCESFSNIPPTIHWDDGSVCINPDFDHVWKYHLAAKGDDGAGGQSEVITLAAGATATLLITVPQEENGMGHYCIWEFLASFLPVAVSIKCDIKFSQGDKMLTNASTFNNVIFGNAQLNTCLPHPITLLPNQTISFHLTSFEAIPVTVRIVARGSRFMPYHDLPLRDEYTRCILEDPSIPMWLGLDTLQVEVPASGTGSGQITIPGGGYFELFYIRGKVQPFGGGPPGIDDILVNISQGRVGVRMMNEPIPLSLVMTDTKIVPGMPEFLYKSASASHALGAKQIFRGNTRVIFDFTNLSAAGDAFVELTFVGAYHFVSACPPNADLERIRREAWDGCGVYEPDYSCGEYPPLEYPLPELPPIYDEYQDAYVPQLPPALPEPEPLRIVSMWRPSQSYFGPGSAPAIPHQYNYGKDQHGRTHLVVRNPNTNEFVRFATAAEQRPFQYTIDEYNRKAGLSGFSGLGGSPQGEWERI